MNKRKIKKLTLSVETLRKLNETDLHEVRGGETERCTRQECTATRACSGCAPCR